MELPVGHTAAVICLYGALTVLASSGARAGPGPLAHAQACAGDPLAVAAAGGYWDTYSMTDAVGGILLGGA
jgi:hypothetical protein